MTSHTLQISALRIGNFALLLVLLLTLAHTARAQARTFYIDYASGSNSNAGTSKAAPWKSHPYMSHAAGCTGGVTGWNGWAHAAGDQYIFKGGATWPAACFPLGLSAGGTSSAQDYYGVDVTWFTGGSFTRPIFDAQSAAIGHFILLHAFNYTTFDDFELKNQNLSLGFGAADAIATSFPPTANTANDIIQNFYIHSFFTTSEIRNGTNLQTDYSAGGIIGYVRLLSSTIDDSDGHGLNANGQQVNGGNIGGGCQDCREVGDTKFVATVAACFGVQNCHGNDISGINQAIQGDVSHTSPSSTSYGLTGVYVLHTQAIEDENAIGGFTVYNNVVHDNYAGINIFVGYCGSQVYNNVLWNNSNNSGIQFTSIPSGDSSGCRGYVYNNTVDSFSPITLYTYSGVSTIHGQIFVQNNIVIGGTIFNSLSGGTITISSNRNPMSASEASTYGFNAAGKYSPASADPSTVAQGINLTSSCSGALAALCQDASGAFWFGGSYKTRPTGSTGWDLGAYQGQGGTTGPPTVSFTSPSPGTVSGAVTLTVTATPQGSATISSCQFTIDGFSFGPPDTSAPYTTTWDSTTVANANHVIGASCTDSNAQVGTAATVSVAVSNSIPGCFISTDNDSGALSWTANQAFTAQTTNFTATFTATPNTNNQDSVIALSQAPMSAYSQGAALVRFNSSGQIDVYKGSLGNYTADATVNYSAGTTYAFTFTVNMTAGTYTVALTSPTSVTLATGYTFRTTASAASLGYINAVSDNTTSDTAQVCNFQIGGSASLTFSPASLDFGNITVGSNSTQTITATTSGGSVNFSSVAISGNADFTINSNTCTGSVPTSCTTQIKFAPTSAALETATVTYTDDATGSPQSVAVSGTGVPATPTLSVGPTSVNFGSVQVLTTSSSGPIVLTISSGPVTFTGAPSFSGPNAADFALASNTCTGSVSAASCQSVVSFTPSLVAAESATLTYTDDATGSPQSVTLAGTGYLSPHPPTAVHATVE